MVLLITLMVLFYSYLRLCSPFLPFPPDMMTSIIFVVQNVGAKQPNYLVTADDVDTLLAIEVLPLDNRKRKVLFSTYHNGSHIHVMSVKDDCVAIN